MRTFCKQRRFIFISEGNERAVIMMIINVCAARVCSGGCHAGRITDGQTDRLVGKPCPPTPPALQVRHWAGSLWPAPSYPRAPGWGRAVSALRPGSPLPSPALDVQAQAGAERTRTSRSRGCRSMAAGARSAHAQRCARVKGQE